MTLEELERAKRLKACIDAANSNLSNYKRLMDSKELRITANDSNMAPTMFIGGETKNSIMEILINKEQKWLDDKLIKLARL